MAKNLKFEKILYSKSKILITRLCTQIKKFYGEPLPDGMGGIVGTVVDFAEKLKNKIDKNQLDFLS